MLLNKYVQNQVKVKISGRVLVWADNYAEGFKYGVNEYELVDSTLMVALNKDGENFLRDKIFDYIRDNMYKKYSRNSRIKKELSVCGNKIEFSQYTNIDNTDLPSKSDFKKFKEGRTDLYVQDVFIMVEVNGKLMSEEDLEILLNL